MMSTVDDTKDSEASVPLKSPDFLPAVPDHRANYRRRVAPLAPRRNNCCQRFLIFLSTVFCVSTLTLVAILVWREFSHKDCSHSHSDIHLRFPGYFRTSEEQKMFEQLTRPFTSSYSEINESVTTDYKCTTSCISDTPEISVNNTVNNSEVTYDIFKYYECCVSKIDYIQPVRLTSIQGRTRTIAQGKHKHQYIRQERCWQNSDCTGCQCVQSNTIVTAVYLRDRHPVDHHDSYAIDYFPVLGNCKCLFPTT